MSSIKMHANRIFFPSAAIFASLSPWFFVMSLNTNAAFEISPSTHAKSLLFGFVSALISGYLLGKIEKKLLYSLLVVWLSGRVCEIVFPNSLLTDSLQVVYGLLLAIFISPKFRSAKKLTNKSISPLIALIGAFPFLYLTVNRGDIQLNISFYTLVMLLSILMFFIGGRAITPLMTRAFADLGEKIPHRVQSKIEGTTMSLLLIAVVLSIIAPESLEYALVMSLSAVLIFIRLFRWKVFFLCWLKPDVLGLTIGYFWLATGLLFYSMSIIFGWQVIASIHVITIGAIGNLSTTVIMIASQKQHSSRCNIWSPYKLTSSLLAAAVFGRLSVAYFPYYRMELMIITTMIWTINFLIVTWYFLKKNRETIHSQQQ